jgi:hypothetical protein
MGSRRLLTAATSGVLCRPTVQSFKRCTDVYRTPCPTDATVRGRLRSLFLPALRRGLCHPEAPAMRSRGSGTSGSGRSAAGSRASFDHHSGTAASQGVARSASDTYVVTSMVAGVVSRARRCNKAEACSCQARDSTKPMISPTSSMVISSK